MALCQTFELRGTFPVIVVIVVMVVIAVIGVAVAVVTGVVLMAILDVSKSPFG